MMAMINSLSTPVIRSQCDLFSTPPTDTSVESSFYCEYKPTVNIQDCDAKLEFKINGNSNQYIDFSDSFLYLKLKVVQEDGSDLEEGDNVSTTNNFLHSIFSQSEVYITNKLFEHANNCYGVKSYLENILSFGSDHLYSQGKCALFIKDTNGCLAKDSNLGYRERKSFISESKILELCDRLKLDICHFDRYLPNNTNFVISLTKARDNFALLSPTENPIVKILDASFFVRKQNLFPSIILSHQKLLESGNNARYSYKSTNVKFFSIPNGNQSFTEENIFQGTLPTRIIIGLVNGSAFAGNYTLNPYKFEHFGLNFISLTVNNIPIPIKALNVDFEKGLSLLPYYLLFPNIGSSCKDSGIIIERDEYADGNCLFAFDFEPIDECSTLKLEKTGTIRLELQFSKAISTSINCIVYSEHQKLLEIDKFRNPVIS